MKIVGVKGYHLNLPIEESAYPGTVGSYLVKVVTDTGLTGYGECPTEYGARGLLRLAGENILGAEPSDVSYIMETQLLGKASASRSRVIHPGLCMSPELAAVEFALWDIIGKSAGLPVCKVLGGAYRKKVALADSIGRMPIDGCLERIDGDIKSGILTVTLKVGANDRREAELLREIRSQFGWELIVRLDAGGAWGDPCDAARIIALMEPYGIQYVQNALDRADGESFRRLRGMTGVPVAIGATFGGGRMTAREARTRLTELIRTDSIDVLAINPSEAGGLYGFTKLAAICDGASVNVVTANARGSLSQAIWATGCIVCGPTAYAHEILPPKRPGGIIKDIAAVPLPVDGGYMRPPEAPGFGIEPDWSAVKAFCAGTEQAGETA